MEKDAKVATEDPKVDLFEDDDEFEEFEINEGFYFLFIFILNCCSITFVFIYNLVICTVLF